MSASIQEAVQQMASLFQDRSRDEIKQLLAELERAGAAIYRSLAEDEDDPSARDDLLRAADREDENAELLERGR